VPRPLAPEIDSRQHAQLIENQRHQFAQRVLVASIPCDQEFGDGAGQNALLN
jgi:hypothetical protein